MNEQGHCQKLNAVKRNNSIECHAFLKELEHQQFADDKCGREEYKAHNVEHWQPTRVTNDDKEC